jgi:membrane protease YdiL (CAAX protease family)
MIDVQNSPLRAGMIPEQRVRWGIPDVLVGIAIMAALVAVNVFLPRLFPWLRGQEILGVIVSALFYVVILAYLIAVSRRRGTGSLRRDFGFELRWVDLAIGLGLFIVIQIIDVETYNFAIGVLHLPVAPVSNVSLPKSEVLAIMYGIGVAGFLAPIAEELFFRGLVLRAVRNVVIKRSKFETLAPTARAKRTGILVSALVFAAFHLYEAQNLTMLFTLGVSIFLFGFLMAWIATRTGRLGPSIVGHILTNSAAAIALLSSRH